MSIRCYTDGSAWLKDMSGGWAWWIDDGQFDSGFVTPATNQTMEMMAVIQALEALEWLGEPVEIVSDSAYVVNCFNQRWYVSWRKKGWRTGSGKGKAVANRELWERLIAVVERFPALVVFTHCRGHGRGGPENAPYVAGNDKVDKLAGAARKAGVAAR